ncbi:hypothetical protein NP233_g8336 [Leucocoprinus birnbaumii]|uniref:Uncharacterized protein n=1 Tax=Leucocoprinus birnbaumii TaxID=56174 RepID=A0AAD5VMM8_9AGAR|nr:hypothetical protein NP233_g8336 [Leucocoprinus birnbaumii]
MTFRVEGDIEDIEDIGIGPELLVRVHIEEESTEEWNDDENDEGEVLDCETADPRLLDRTAHVQAVLALAAPSIVLVVARVHVAAGNDVAGAANGACYGGVDVAGFAVGEAAVGVAVPEERSH